jgi:hypothetical protein
VRGEVREGEILVRLEERREQDGERIRRCLGWDIGDSFFK